jgi:hypothetical protein
MILEQDNGPATAIWAYALPYQVDISALAGKVQTKSNLPIKQACQ